MYLIYVFPGRDVADINLTAKLKYCVILFNAFGLNRNFLLDL